MGTSKASDRAVRGWTSRANGENFERIVLSSAAFYESKGVSVIDKTPEPMRIIRPYDRKAGQFVACFVSQAQPDFKGILKDSTMILFDAKHTDQGQIRRDVVTEEQEACFERYRKMGAMCFLVVSLGFESFYRVPWIVFRDMKTIFGHKFMNCRELAPYKIEFRNGRLLFLDGLELRDKADPDIEEDKAK